MLIKDVQIGGREWLLWGTWSSVIGEVSVGLGKRPCLCFLFVWILYSITNFHVGKSWLIPIRTPNSPPTLMLVKNWIRCICISTNSTIPTRTSSKSALGSQRLFKKRRAERFLTLDHRLWIMRTCKHEGNTASVRYVQTDPILIGTTLWNRAVRNVYACLDKDGLLCVTSVRPGTCRRKCLLLCHDGQMQHGPCLPESHQSQPGQYHKNAATISRVNSASSWVCGYCCIVLLQARRNASLSGNTSRMIFEPDTTVVAVKDEQNCAARFDRDAKPLRTEEDDADDSTFEDSNL